MLLDLSISELAAKLRDKEVSAVDVATESLETIEKHDFEINSFITVREREEILSDAKASDARRTSGSHLLEGIPFSLKDAYLTTNARTTSASNVLETFRPPYNATVYNRLTENGAILIGKNNQDAWGHGGSTENTDFGPTKNPWDTSRISGGSSGGTAAAIAARMVSFGIGEDTGGSIRNPSNFNNISGLKVTYGRVSRLGTIAYASSLDTVGPMAKSVEDLALLLEVMAGSDPLDASSSHRPVDFYTQFLKNDIKNMVVGVPKEFFTEGLSPTVKSVIDQALSQLENLGAKITEVSIPLLADCIPIYYLIALSETSSNMARYDGIRYGNGRNLFTDETKRRIMLGTFALSTGYAEELYKRAQQARTLLIQEFDQAFSKCDLLVGPVTPTPAHKIGDLINDPLQNMLADLYTVSSNVTGIPSLSVPAGFTDDGLPVGLQILGPKFAEKEVLKLGYQFEQATKYKNRSPIESKY